MPYIMYSKFKHFICYFFDFMIFFVVLEQNLTTRSGEISVFRAKFAYF